MRFALGLSAAVLGVLVGGCGGEPAPHGDSVPAGEAAQVAGSPLEVLRPSELDAHFAQVLSPRQFVFPADHGPHPHYRHEWWYLTGHLEAMDGEEFGFEVTFFRVGLVPPQESSATPEGGEASRWRARQIYVAHFAVTDLARRQFHSTERRAREALGLAGAASEPLRVWLGPWSLAADPAAPEAESDRPVWALRVQDERYGLDLKLRALQAPVLNGDGGLSIKSDSPGAASYYYSIPRLEVQGRLVREGKPIAVTGLAWLDREWGSGSLGRELQGWDWYALELDDGSSLMFYTLRARDGGRDRHSAGTWSDATGASGRIASEDMRIDVLDSWVSPEGTRYPSRWRIRSPSLGLDLAVDPVLANQELQTTPRYWEGKVSVAGTRGGRSVRGRGYVELVGYALSAAARKR